jgi:hypothetical protein
MYMETSAKGAPAPVPPCCPNCWEVMHAKDSVPWTLLRGHQLRIDTFECNVCGYATTRIRDEDQ